MSGLSHTPGKRAKGKTFRGFESRLLRHINSISVHSRSLVAILSSGSIGKTSVSIRNRSL